MITSRTWEESGPTYSAGEILSRTKIYNECPLQYGTQCTRLLELLPGAFPETVKCRLLHHNFIHSILDSHIKYDALSYVWGDCTVLQPILVNGALFGITENLHAALVYLRDLAKPRYLWVDSICINQSDNAEKNHQINKMKLIYQNAEHVVAWLAEAADDDTGTVRNIEAAIQHISGDRNGINTVDKPSSDIEIGMTMLLTKSYWKRVWVIQEVAVATQCSFQYRHQRLALDQFIAYITTKTLRSFYERGSPTYTARSFIRLLKRQDDDVYGYLLDSAQLQTTRLVDKIYGLLGIFPESFRKELQPDYHKSYQNVMVDVVRACIMLYGTIDIINCLAPFHRESHIYGYRNWPSWLPTVTGRSDGLGESYNTPGSRAQPEIRISDTALEAKGFAISRISSVQGPFETSFGRLKENSRGGKPSASLEKLWISALESLGRRYPSIPSAELEAKFFLMAGGDKIYGHSGKWRRIQSHEELWSDMVEAERTGFQVQPPSGAVEFGFVFARLYQRCFFITESGHLGLGSDDIQQGDLVCVLYGCRLPVILRNITDGEGPSEYKFHGPAYLDGIMRGETQIECDYGLEAETTFCMI